MIKIKNKINYQINIDNSEEKIYNILNRSNIQIFTYEDYLKYQKFIKAKTHDIANINGVQEESETYLLKNVVNNKHKENKIKNENDKICRKMLDIKIEAVQFINKIIHTNYKENEIEKYKKGEDLSNCIDSIVKEINKNKKEYIGKGKDVLLIMIAKILKEKLGEEKTELIIKEMKGEEKEMLQILETIREENEEIRQEGRMQGRKEGRRDGIRYSKKVIIREMLKRNMPIELISEITHSTKKAILKIGYTSNK